MDKMSSSIHREPSSQTETDEKNSQHEFHECVDRVTTESSLYQDTLTIVDHENIKIIIEAPCAEEESNSTTRL